MHKSILFITFLWLPVILFSQSVNKETAEQAAVHFMNHRSSVCSEYTVQNVETLHKNTTKTGYLITLEPSGFIVISASKNTVPVLGYGYNTPDEKPDGFSFWINQYMEAVNDAILQGAAPTQEITQQWERLINGNPDQKNIRSVEPMLSSTWNQNKYYNRMCPQDPSGPDGRCYAGCVACAMGQLMYYYRWPQTGTGYYEYNHPDYGMISADYENTTYQWDAMEDNLNNHNLAIAQLLFHAGVGVDMDYGPNGSGMYNHSADYVLRTYFKYCPETDYIFRDSTSLSWDSILISNLNNKRPLYYAGWTADSLINISGHAFVCDGYESEEYFHFNWGWGGSYDGYFYVDNLNPGIAFNFGQEVITNIYPDTMNYVYPYPIESTNTISFINGTLTDGSGPENYNPGTTINWLLAPGDENYDSITSVTLSFASFNLTENQSYLRIYDGGSNQAPLAGSYSGNTLPSSFSSSADSVFIVFEAGEGASEGFKLRYSSTIPVFCSGMTSIYDESGTISDESGNKNYTGNNLCRYWIKDVGDWDNVWLIFDYIELADENDKLEIMDPSVNPPVTLESFTGPLSLTNYSINGTNNQLFVLFHTNGIYNADGFEASFQRGMVGINDNLSGDIQVYPVPATEVLNIVSDDQWGPVESVLIFNMSGKLTSVNNTGNKHSFKILVDDLSNGIYTLQLIGKDKCLTRKIVIL